MSDLDNINSSFEQKIKSLKSKEELQSLKSEFFGKSGQITNQFKNLGTITGDKRKEFASSLNKLKDNLTTQLENKFLELETLEINEKLKDQKIDITLPIRSFQNGKIHPVSQVIDEISSIFSEIGFSVAEGPDVETEMLRAALLEHLPTNCRAARSELGLARATADVGRPVL